MPTLAPYRRIAVATTFSPRFKQVLAESKRMRRRFGAELELIYAGKQTDEVARTFRDALTELELPSSATIHYREGDPAEAILSTAAENDIDLLIAGALQKEVILRPFLGDVARRLVRKAECSVLLFTKPDLDPKPLKQIVFIGDYSDHAREALKRTFHLAAAESCERLHVVRVYTSFDQARAALTKETEKPEARRTFEEEEKALEEFILSAGETEVPLEARCLRGNTGFAASDFVQSINADLLVVPLRNDPSVAGKLPNYISWISDVIPCNLWVIR